MQNKESRRPLELWGVVAAEMRGSIAVRQAAGSLPWFGVDDPAEEQRLRADHADRVHESVNFQLHRSRRPAARVVEKRRLGKSVVRGRR